MGRSHSHGNHRGVRWLLTVLIGIVLVVIVGYIWINSNPGAAAQGANALRAVIGDNAVAQLEGVVYSVQDSALKLRYKVTGSKASAPWQASLGPTVVSLTPTAGPPTATPAPTSANAPSPTPGPSLTPTVTPTPAWALSNIKPLGSLEGEGVWQPYITGDQGQVYAVRTYLQPDPERPFAIVAVVAFNLDRIHLHFVLGRDEPYSEVQIDRPGIIDPADVAPGKLLAVFNGGFQARHGNFGVGVGDTVVIPPKPDMGALVIYPAGSVTVGQWGDEIDPTSKMAVWRQNGPLVVHRGEINPNVGETDPTVWGYTIKETAPVWRSGAGISPDGRTLYYFAGSNLSLPTLGIAMQSAGAYNAMMLDINNYWVHFDAITFKDGLPVPNALFDYMGSDNPNRYLQPYTRDYFYVTAADQ
jgi:hypothetical protein